VIDFRATRLYSKVMQKLLVQVLDDFLPEPQTFREMAVKSSFYSIYGPDGELYKNIHEMPTHQLEPLLTEKLGKSATVGYNLLRINYAGENPNNAIHSDNGYEQFAGVVYLNRPEDCQGGTAFWRHKKYDIIACPTVDEIRSKGRRPQRVYAELQADSNEVDKWEQIHVAEMKFNRGVFYNSRFFHSRWPLAAFGDSKENARLIIATFFNLT